MQDSPVQRCKRLPRVSPQEMGYAPSSLQSEHIRFQTPVLIECNGGSCWTISLVSGVASCHGRASTKGRTERADDLGRPRHHRTQWFVFTAEQYDPKSPWADKRVRQAANHAFNRQAVNETETLGYWVLTGGIVPRKFDFALPLEPYTHDPNKAKQLLEEAGYPNGFEAGECSGDSVYSGVMEALVNDLATVGIRAKVRTVERAAAFTAHREKTFKNLAFQGSGAFGNAAT
jgi:hypothetical protein